MEKVILTMVVAVIAIFVILNKKIDDKLSDFQTQISGIESQLIIKSFKNPDGTPNSIISVSNLKILKKQLEETKK